MSATLSPPPPPTHTHKHTHTYCNLRNFRTRFNFVYFVLLAESTEFSSIGIPCTCTSVRDIGLAVRKFIVYESSRMLEYEIFAEYENFCDYSIHMRARAHKHTHIYSLGQ